MRSPDLPIPDDLRALWDTVEVIVLDERNMQFILPNAFAPFIDYLSFGVLPEHLLGDMNPGEILNAPYNLQPVGSGPFRFQELLSENDEVTGVVLNAWDGYYLGRPFVDQVVFHYYDTSEAAFGAYQQGDVMGVSYLSPDVLPQALADSTMNVYSSRLPRLSLLLLNLNNSEVPFFSEQPVRRAMLEGMCYESRWILEHMQAGGTRIHTVYLSGGGSKSPLWCQLHADVLQRPVTRASNHPPPPPDLPCLGRTSGWGRASGYPGSGK